MAKPNYEYNPLSCFGFDKTYKDAIEALEDTYVRLEIFEEVNSPSGTLTQITGATVVLDQYAKDVDAICTTITNTGQKPNEELARDSPGIVADCTLSGTGNLDYALSVTPVGSQYAIQYVIDIKFSDYKNIDRNIILAADEVVEAREKTVTAVTFADSPFSVLDDHEILQCDCTNGEITLNYPTAVGRKGKEWTVTKVDSTANVVVNDPYLTETIRTDATMEIQFQKSSANIYSDGANLWVK